MYAASVTNLNPPKPRHTSEIRSDIVILRATVVLEWNEINTKLQVHPETARQLFMRVKEQAGGCDHVDELLKYLNDWPNPNHPK